MNGEERRGEGECHDIALGAAKEKEISPRVPSYANKKL